MRRVLQDSGVLKPEQQDGSSVGWDCGDTDRQGSVTRRFVSPTTFHIQYTVGTAWRTAFSEIQWIRQLKEKYELTTF